MTLDLLLRIKDMAPSGQAQFVAQYLRKNGTKDLDQTQIPQLIERFGDISDLSSSMEILWRCGARNEAENLTKDSPNHTARTLELIGLEALALSIHIAHDSFSNAAEIHAKRGNLNLAADFYKDSWDRRSSLDDAKKSLKCYISTEQYGIATSLLNEVIEKKRRFSEEDALDFIKISIGINRIDQVLNIYRKTDGTAQFFGDCMKIENFLEEDKEKLFQEIYQNEKSNVTLVKTASNFGLYNLASQYIDTLNHEELEQIGIYDFETIAKNVDRRDLKERLIGLYENKNEYESAAEVALELGLLKRAKRNAQMYINSSENGNAPMNKVRIAYKVGLGNRADILNEEIKNLERKGNFEVCLNLAKIAGDQERIALYGLIIED